MVFWSLEAHWEERFANGLLSLAPRRLRWPCLRRRTTSSTKTATRIRRAISISRSIKGGQVLRSTAQTMMKMELDEGEKAALINLLTRTIAADPFPLSPRI